MLLQENGNSNSNKTTATFGILWTKLFMTRLKTFWTVYCRISVSYLETSLIVLWATTPQDSRHITENFKSPCLYDIHWSNELGTFVCRLYLSALGLILFQMRRFVEYVVSNQVMLIPLFCLFVDALQWGAADTEIKVPSGENTEPKRSPFQAWSRSVYSHTCYAYCQGFLPCLFLPFGPFTCIFSKTSSDFFLHWLTSVLCRPAE